MVGLIWLCLQSRAPVQASPASPPREDDPLTVSSESPNRVQRIVGVRFEGLQRSDPHWATTYLGLGALPRMMGLNEARELGLKLLTTGVFTAVEPRFDRREAGVAAAVPIADRVLVFSCDEKWTTIPVARAQVGGGTPLHVLGAYDTHSFGKLLTLGGELRRYGDAPPGGVLYAKAPRWHEGKHYAGIELWRDFRRRSLFDRHDTEAARLDVHGWRLRLQLLIPWLEAGKASSLQWGVDTWLNRHSSLAYRPTPGRAGAPVGAALDLTVARPFEGLVLPSFVYDDILIDNIHYAGLRLSAKAGFLYDHRGGHPALEAESFYYALGPGALNLAVHGFVGSRASDSVFAQYFLGGFDSIRGIPDGALYGSQAAYANIELRYLAAKFRYLWLQGAAFVDAGSAGPRWQDLPTQGRSAVGLGVRLAVPQIYRMMLRIDYAQSLERGGSRGISAGLEQFFQPYRPL